MRLCHELQTVNTSHLDEQTEQNVYILPSL